MRSLHVQLLHANLVSSVVKRTTHQKEGLKQGFIESKGCKGKKGKECRVAAQSMYKLLSVECLIKYHIKVLLKSIFYLSDIR